MPGYRVFESKDQCRCPVTCLETSASSEVSQDTGLIAKLTEQQSETSERLSVAIRKEPLRAAVRLDNPQPVGSNSELVTMMLWRHL